MPARFGDSAGSLRTSHGRVDVWATLLSVHSTKTQVSDLGNNAIPTPGGYIDPDPGYEHVAAGEAADSEMGGMDDTTTMDGSEEDDDDDEHIH